MRSLPLALLTSLSILLYSWVAYQHRPSPLSANNIGNVYMMAQYSTEAIAGNIPDFLYVTVIGGLNSGMCEAPCKGRCY